MIKQLLAPTISTFLIKGNPGTGKSSLAMEILRRNGTGTYVTTRVSKEKMALQNSELRMVVVGGTEREFSAGGKAVDTEDYRFAVAKNVVRLVLEKLSSNHGGVIVLDSWDSIAKEMDQVERLRTEKTLVAAVESSDSKLCFVSEEPTLTTTDYLVDAIVELRSELKHHHTRRTLEIKKMRGEAVINPVRLFSLENGRFAVCAPTQVLIPRQYEPKPYKPIPNPPHQYSSGCVDLDSMFGGGFYPGSSLAIEHGVGVSQLALRPFDSLVMANFVANGGCVVNLPPSGVPPEAVLDPLRAILPKEKVDSMVRVGYYDVYDDPCVFSIDSNSMEETFAKVWQTIDRVRGQDHRPCYVQLGIEKMEYIHGEGLMKYVVTSISRAKHDKDVIVLVVDYTTKVRDSVAAVADSHFLFEDYDNTLTGQALKPLSSIAAIEYSYSKGYPQISLLPMT